MKFGTVSSIVAVVSLVVPTLAAPMDLGDLGLTAINNIFRTPPCAMKCILDPHWLKTYAPECSDMSVGKDLGIRLCQNYMYQAMIDDCIKGKCDDGETRGEP